MEKVMKKVDIAFLVDGNFEFWLSDITEELEKVIEEPDTDGLSNKAEVYFFYKKVFERTLGNTRCYNKKKAKKLLKKLNKLID